MNSGRAYTIITHETWKENTFRESEVMSSMFGKSMASSTIRLKFQSSRCVSLPVSHWPVAHLDLQGIGCVLRRRAMVVLYCTSVITREYPMPP